MKLKHKSASCPAVPYVYRHILRKPHCKTVQVSFKVEVMLINLENTSANTCMANFKEHMFAKKKICIHFEDNFTVITKRYFEDNFTVMSCKREGTDAQLNSAGSSVSHRAP